MAVDVGLWPDLATSTLKGEIISQSPFERLLLDFLLRLYESEEEDEEEEEGMREMEI